MKGNETKKWNMGENKKNEKIDREIAAFCEELDSVCAWIEKSLQGNEDDLEAFTEAYADYQAHPVTYSLDEVEREISNKE